MLEHRGDGIEAFVDSRRRIVSLLVGQAEPADRLINTVEVDFVDAAERLDDQILDPLYHLTRVDRIVDQLFQDFFETFLDGPVFAGILADLMQAALRAGGHGRVDSSDRFVVIPLAVGLRLFGP